ILFNLTHADYVRIVHNDVHNPSMMHLPASWGRYTPSGSFSWENGTVWGSLCMGGDSSLLCGYSCARLLLIMETTKGIKISPVDMEERAKIALSSGDTIRVWQKIQEKDKIRLQAFEGLVLARKHGKESGATFTVRKVIDGVGVERIFPLYSPAIDKIEIIRRAKVRRSKLYYVREKAAKEIRRQMRNIIQEKPKAEESVTVEAEKVV
ncbi:MAG: ribosomal protein large subunit ribosomal protein, partial [Parcubacteria group bacterium]|nr:ribosomal protein large subunit ribosomal protein [Parcubacteria group bacterium]